jgi:hypothetical protein
MELWGIQNQHPKKKKSLDTEVRSFLENSCSILSFFKIVIIFNNTSADFALISADVLLKMITVLKELRITQLCSKKERTLIKIFLITKLDKFSAKH